MYIAANYEVSLNGSKNEIKAMTTLVAEKLNKKSIIGKAQFRVEDDRFFTEQDEIQNLAVMMAKVAGNATIMIKGFIDYSAMDGHYKDFEITVANGKLVAMSTDFYTELSAGELYADYEEFCDEYQDEDGEPLFTEEQYEEFCEGEYCVVGYDKRNVVAEVPMAEKYELTIA